MASHVTTYPTVTAIPPYNIFPSGDTSGVPDYVAIQTALTLLAGVTAVRPAPGLYYIAFPLNFPNNSSLIGSDWSNTTFRAVAGNPAIIFDNTADVILFICGITFDANNIGTCVTIAQVGGQYIRVHRCRFMNAVQPAGVALGWPFSIGTFGSPAIDTVEFFDNIVGPNTPFLESCVFVNCQHLRIRGNTFRDFSTTGSAGLVLYGGCSDFSIVNNNTYGIPANGFGGYIQECSDGVVEGNTYTNTNNGITGLWLPNNSNIKIGHNTWRSSGTSCAGISLYDIGGNFYNQNPHIFTNSSDINIAEQSMAGFTLGITIGPPLVANPQNITVGSMTDIDITGGTYDVVSGKGIAIGSQVATNMQRIKVHDVHVKGTYSATFQTAANTGGIAVVGNAGSIATTINGLQNGGQGIIGAPAAPAGLTAVGGGTLKARTYTLAFSYSNGSRQETIATATSTIAVTANQAIQANAPVQIGTGVAATQSSSWYVYMDSAAAPFPANPLRRVAGPFASFAGTQTITAEPSSNAPKAQVQSTYPQAVLLVSNANIQVGMWLRVNTAPVEDIWVQNVGTDGANFIRAIFSINAIANHTAGGESIITPNAGTYQLVNNGLTDVTISKPQVDGGGGTGVSTNIAGINSNVQLIDSDLHNTTGIVETGTGFFAIKQRNRGYNPKGAVLTTSNTICSPIMGANGTPSINTSYTNVSGFDLDLICTAGGATITTITVQGNVIYTQASAALPVGLNIPWPNGTVLLVTGTAGSNPVFSVQGA